MDGSRARALLGVPAHATAEEIRAAFRRAARGAHPDGGGAPERFRDVVAARDELLRAAPRTSRRVSRRPGRWDLAAPARPTLDVVDVARHPVPRTRAGAGPAFDDVLAAVLAA